MTNVLVSRCRMRKMGGIPEVSFKTTQNRVASKQMINLTDGI